MAGTRIPVRVVIEHIAGGDDVETLLAAFPGLTRDDIAACLEHAAFEAGLLKD